MNLANPPQQAAESCEAFSAVALPWPEIEEWHEARFGPYGLIPDLYQFPAGRLQRDAAGNYVRAVLSAMAFSEEWDPDFWQISREERRRCLTLGRSIYEGYTVVRDLRMQKTGHIFPKKTAFSAAEARRISGKPASAVWSARRFRKPAAPMERTIYMWRFRTIGCRSPAASGTKTENPSVPA